MSISELIAANQAKPANATADKTRFMLELEPKVREKLRKLCKDDLGCGEIKFASELFTTALEDAIKAYNEIKAKQATEAKK